MIVAFATIALVGLFAGLVMAGMIVGAQKIGILKTDPFWLLGRLFSRSIHRAHTVGFLMHMVASVFFALIYVGSWTIFGTHQPALFVGIGLLTGLVHGAAIGITFLIVYANRTNGWRAGMVQIASQGIYGLILGVTIGILETKYGTLTHFSHIF